MIKDGENSFFCGDDEVFFYYKKVTGHPSLNIWFPGAYNRRKGIRQYQRHTWVNELKGSFLIFDDPTVSEENDLSIGWFQGRDGGLLGRLVLALEKIIPQLGFEERDVVFFGSSAGGFVSLKLSEYFKKSKAVVINPQSCVLRYSDSHVRKMLEYSYNKSAKELDEGEVFNITYQPSSEREGNIFYFQNIEDAAHHKKHMGYVLDNLPADGFLKAEYPCPPNLSKGGKIIVVEYKDVFLKHNPPGIEETKKFFEYSFC